MTDAEATGVTHAPSALIPSWFSQERTRLLTPEVSMPSSSTSSIANGPVVYWMSRDCRTHDNWALLFAQHLAQRSKTELRVVYAFCPPPQSDGASAISSCKTPQDMPPLATDMSMTERHAAFLVDGLKIVQQELAQKDVSFQVCFPLNRDTVGSTVYQTHARDAIAVVSDFSPLRLSRTFLEEQAAPLLERNGIPLYQVDAHNIVPVWHASPKREVGARTLRPKINKLLPEFLTPFVDFEGNNHLLDDAKTKARGGKKKDSTTTDEWDQTAKTYLKSDSSIKALPTLYQAGHKAAMKRFQSFCSSSPNGNGLKNFSSSRNDPNHSDVCSNLSPWINYGQVSFQRLAMEVRALKKHPMGTAAFIEEGVIRRELSDNYCFYSPDTYDSLDAAAGWARESLEIHSTDRRSYLYTLKEFVDAETYDDLWNAAQLQLVKEGTMHGFLRMYWAKKILEWTPNAAVALRTGLYLNDRYALDGNDPNGFTGVAWSVMGIHDMGWKERPIFGKIRFMNYAGCQRKFKVKDFVAKYDGAYRNSLKAIRKHGGEVPSSSKTKKKGTKRKAA